MWKTIYAIGLALPRILFRPMNEFQIVIPTSGNPFVRVPTLRTTLLSQANGAIRDTQSLSDQMNKLSERIEVLSFSIKELPSVAKPLPEEPSDVLSEIIRTSKEHNIDLVEFIKLQKLEDTFREKKASQKTVLENHEGGIKDGKEAR